LGPRHRRARQGGAAVGKRFAQWVLDTARAEYDQAGLDQDQIGLRHPLSKKAVTGHAQTASHIRGRDLVAFAAATVAPMRPYPEKAATRPKRCRGCRTPDGSR
jgi:hypothetical protein